jgi:MFS family permease
MKRNATVLVAISLLSGFGGAAMSLATGVWILDLTHSSSIAGLIGLCVYAPTLAGPGLGVLVDRLPRRAVLVGTNALLVTALLTLFAVTSAAWVWLIFAVMLVYGVSQVLLSAGESALLPATLDADTVGTVNGLRLSAREGMKLVAPLAGAGIYAWRGGHAVAALSALTLVGAAALYGVLRVDPHRVVPARSNERGIRPGLTYLRGQPVLRRVVLVSAVAIAVSGFNTAATYATVTVDLRLPSTFLGVLGSAQGAGSILGGLVAGRLMARYGELRVGAVGGVLFATATVARCIPSMPLSVACSVVVGIGLPWTLVAAMTAVQRHTPSELLGRVSATVVTLLFGPIAAAIPLGSAAALLGARPPLIVGALACLAVAVPPLRRSGAHPSIKERFEQDQSVRTSR